MIHSATDLLTLARTYSDATGMPFTSLGVRACGNDKIYRFSQRQELHALDCGNRRVLVQPVLAR